MKSCKRSLSVVLALVMLLAFLPAASVFTADAAVERGVCGENLSYVLYDSGLLTFDGKGTYLGFDGEVWEDETGSYYVIDDDDPWYVIKELAEQNRFHAVEISYPIKEIGQEAFKGCTCIKDVIIDSSVTDIDTQAFSGCTGLTSVVVPDSVEHIGLKAFEGCVNLTTMRLPFVGVSEDPYFKYWGLFGCIFGSEYNVPEKEGYTSQWAYTTTDYTGEDTLVLYYHVPASLTTVAIGEGVTSIPERAFEDCTGITALMIPKTVSSIGKNAFRKCTNVTLYGRKSSYVETWATQNNVPFVGGYSCGKDLNYTLKDGVMLITGANTKLGFDQVQWYSDDFGEEPYCVRRGDWNNIWSMADDNSFHSVKVLAPVLTVDEDAFQDVECLTSIELPCSVKEIDEDAFSGCTGLTTLDLKGSVMYFRNRAFMNCTGLTSLELQDGVYFIEGSVFYGCTGLTSVELPDSVYSIYGTAFGECPNLTYIRLPFIGYTRSVDPDSSNGKFGYIFGRADYDYTLSGHGLAAGETAERISVGDDYAYLVHKPGYVSQYGYSEYYTNEFMEAEPELTADITFLIPAGLAEVVIAGDITAVPAKAFEGCSCITDLTLPGGVETIGKDAFKGCGDITLHLKTGSYAQNWASNNGIPFDNKPPRVHKLSVSIAGDGKLLLSWNKAPNATQYNIYRSVNGGAFKYMSTVNGTSRTVSDLSSGSTYAFKVISVQKRNGVTAVGADSEIVSAKAVATPAVPQNVTVKATGDKQLTISWKAVSGATQYNLYRYNSTKKEYVYKGTKFIDDANPTQYIDKTVAAGTTYYYKVVAVTKGEGFTFVSEKSAKASAKAVAAPAVPQNVTAKATGDRELTISWKAVSGATQYNLYRYNGAKKTYVYKGTTFATAAKPTQYIDKTLAAGTTYYYKVVAVTKTDDLTLTSDKSASANAKAVAAPAVPSNVTVKATADKTLTVSWKAVSGATQYNVYRYRGSDKQYHYIGTVRTTAAKPTEYADSGLNLGTTYHYKVVAVTKTDDLTLTSDKSKDASAKVLGTPAVPQNVKAVSNKAKTATVSWSAVTGATQYNVYRYNGTKKTYVYVGTSYGTSYDVTDLSSGTTYYFKVVAACKGDGLTFVSEKSASASAKVK